MPTPVAEVQYGRPGLSDFEIAPESARLRSATISIALPSSILSNAQSPELRIYLGGQIARAAAIYCIDEIVIFEEKEDRKEREPREARRRQRDNTGFNPTELFKLILEYLETPQYLRKHLFPVSPELRLVGLLNPLALPSHVAKNDYCRWREGIAVGRGTYPRNQGHRAGHWGANKGVSENGPPSRFVDVGQERLAEIDMSIPIGDRVTIDMEPSGPDYGSCPGKYLFGRLADRDAPKRVKGTYWGYRVRTADSLAGVFTGSAVAPEGYDLAVGTSERGTPIRCNADEETAFELPEFSHLLIVFGGVLGLEKSVEGDNSLESLGISSANGDGDPIPAGQMYNVSDLFDFYVNTCPNQGSRTIRTEEAILVSLAAIQPYLRPRQS